MADTLNINLKQEDGGCKTIKYNKSDVKTLRLNGITIWQHKSRVPASYTFGKFEDMHDDYEWEIDSLMDLYTLADNIGGNYYTDYSFSSTTGCGIAGSRIADRRDLETNVYYYIGAGSDWIARIIFFDNAVSNGVIGGTDTNGTWHGDDQEGYTNKVAVGAFRREVMNCTVTYKWVVD